VIELDGGQHANQVHYDATRTQELEKAGFAVIRFWDRDVLTRTDAVLERLYQELGCPSP
jgi:very-short-patch-repair endonuclease